MRNNGKTELEKFFRKLMAELGLGFQCYYKNRAKNTHRKGTPGHWLIKIWDQRPGHYVRATKSDTSLYDLQHKYKDAVRTFKGRSVSYNSSPSQKWYNNQQTDHRFMIVGPECHGVGADHKEEFLSWLLFGKDPTDGLFARIANELGSSFGAKDAINMSSLVLGRAINNPNEKSLMKLNEEYKVLREKHLAKERVEKNEPVL